MLVGKAAADARLAPFVDFHDAVIAAVTVDVLLGNILEERLDRLELLLDEVAAAVDLITFLLLKERGRQAIVFCGKRGIFRPHIFLKQLFAADESLGHVAASTGLRHLSLHVLRVLAAGWLTPARHIVTLVFLHLEWSLKRF